MTERQGRSSKREVGKREESDIREREEHQKTSNEVKSVKKGRHWWLRGAIQ